MIMVKNNVIIILTAFTTNTHPQRLFFSVQTCGLVDVNQLLPWVLCVDLEKILSQFLKHSEEENVGI